MQKLRELERFAYVYYPFSHPDDLVYPLAHRVKEVRAYFEAEPLAVFINLSLVYQFLPVPGIAENEIHQYVNAKVWTVGGYSYARFSERQLDVTNLHVTFIHRPDQKYTEDFKDIPGMLVHDRANISQALSVPGDRYLVATPVTISQFIAYTKTPENVGLSVRAIQGNPNQKLASLLLAFLMDKAPNSDETVVLDQLGPTTLRVTHHARTDRVFYDSKGNPHRVIRRLGSGVDGSTYEVEGGMCVKICDVYHGETEYRAAQLLKNLNHPGREFIIQYFDAKGDRYGYTFFMELCDETLAQYVSRVKTSPYLGKWATQLTSMCQALNVVDLEHGDLHANNIMLKNGDIRVIDFGRSSLTRDVSDNGQQVFWLLDYMFITKVQTLEAMMKINWDVPVDSRFFEDSI